MLSKRHLLAFLCTSLTLATVAAAQGALSALGPRDAYPDRDLLLDRSFAVCGKLSTFQVFGEKEVQEVLQQELKISAKPLKSNRDQTGWTMDLETSSAPKAFLRLIKSGPYFTFSFRQSESTIEGIADISMDGNCRNLNEARFTFYNSFLRPVQRIKINSLFQTVQTVVMEEPVKDPHVLGASTRAVRIGVIDSGIDYNHQSLIAKTRPMLGVDLIDPSRPPYDYTNTVQNELMGKRFSHGSAVADIASRDLDALIVPVRIENQSKLVGRAVEYLAQKQVRIVNLSQGTVRKDDWLPFQAAVEKHPEILFIVSAGNEGKNIDLDPFYPSGFEAPNMLVVASIGREGLLSSFSNYGSKHVHFAALGENVSAALAGGGVWSVSGTSFAAPLVTRIAAKLLSENQALTAQELKKILIQKAKPRPELKDKVQYGVLEISSIH